MANGLYDTARAGFLGNTSLDWDTDAIRTILIDHGGDTPSLTVDEFLDDRAAPSRISVSSNLTGKTTTAGVADADDVTHSAVSGATCESIDIYQHTGTDATSALIANIDTATGLPVTPGGGDITIRWDPGANRIFKL